MVIDVFPSSLERVIGNKPAIREIIDAIKSAKIREDSAPHLLLTGPAGTGKTSISKLISYEMGSQFYYIMGPSVSKKQNIALLLLNLDDNDILMIDEIHGLDKSSAETFYNAMLNYELTIIGENNEITSIPLKKFTVIGATTNPGGIENALRQRFRQIRIELYSVDDLLKILINNAIGMDLSVDEDTLEEIAKRSRGTPRIGIYFLEKVRDLVLSRFDLNIIYMQDALLMFQESGIEENGCNRDDMRYLEILKNRFSCGPIGLNSMSSALDMSKDYIQSEIEPWLASLGYIERNPKGRILVKDI